MNAEQRREVRDNALYLRQVRPIDPEEIHEYVSDRPHPAAVRQVLREQAPALALIERDDGTFVPVAEEPISARPATVEAFPERYARVLEDELVERFGAGWPSDTGGDRLRARIREVKQAYLDGRPVEYDDLTALGYAIYHLPGYYAAGRYVFADLAAEGLLDHHLRVLDVGAGVGGPALGLADVLPADALLDYHAVEPSAAADLLDPLLAEAGRNVHATVHRTTAEAFDPAAVLPEEAGSDEADDSTGFDLILFGNVLRELADAAGTVARYADWLASDGTLVALAPADRNTATNLREVERAVADDGPLGVYAPTCRLWPGERPTSECWSFDCRPDLDVPGFQRRLDDAGAGRGEFVNADVQFAYSLLRTDDRRRVDVTLNVNEVAKMANMDDHVTNRIDLAAIKLSHDLSEPDANPLFLVGDGSESVDHYAVLIDRSALNERLERADYGELLFFENVLVLWNDDERAYNLVVDGETVVD
jgi:hypothetical protein